MKINKRDFTHYGWLYGIVPVYVNMEDDEVPTIIERHWCLQPWMAVCDVAFCAVCWIVTAVNPDYEPEFGIYLSGEIEQ